MTKALVVAAILASVRIAAAQPTPEAERLYREGQEAYDAKKYDVALAKWEKSYELSKIPALVFNIAQAARLNNDCTKAVASYKKFVELDPASTERPDADGFIKELQPQCPEKPVIKPVVKPVEKPIVQKPIVTPPPPPPHPGRTKKLVGLVSIGAGVAIAATGLYFGGKAKDLANEVDEDCADGCTWDDIRDKDADGKSAETKQYILLGAGGAIAITGVVLYMLGKRADSSLAITPRTEGGATVSILGRF
ncbi:MAG: hypothetical protein ABI867_28535 [Kofleriaceae bacterium]